MDSETDLIVAMAKSLAEYGWMVNVPSQSSATEGRAALLERDGRYTW